MHLLRTVESVAVRAVQSASGAVCLLLEDADDVQLFMSVIILK